MSTDQNINSGLWHYNAGLYNQAIPMLLSGTESLNESNPRDSRLPSSYLALAAMAYSSKRLDIAEQYYDQAIASAEKYNSSDVSIMRNVYSSKGYFYLNNHRYLEAIPFLEKAASLSKNNESINKKFFAIDLDNLGLANEGTCQLDEANKLSAQALNVLSALPPSNDIVSTRGVILYNLAHRNEENGNNAEAEQYYKRAVEDILVSKEIWRITTVKTSYAAFLKKLGRNLEAEAIK